MVAAGGTATYGDLDRAILALDHVPDDHYIRPLAGTLPGFLPLPPELDPVRDPAAAAEWLRDSSARLRWVPGSHFELEGPVEGRAASPPRAHLRPALRLQFLTAFPDCHDHAHLPDC